MGAAGAPAHDDLIAVGGCALDVDVDVGKGVEQADAGGLELGRALINALAKDQAGDAWFAQAPELIIAFRHLHPQRPSHYLIIQKGVADPNLSLDPNLPCSVALLAWFFNKDSVPFECSELIEVHVTPRQDDRDA